MVRQGGENAGGDRLETIISYILKVGVLISFVTLSFGLLLFRHVHGSWAISQNRSAFISGGNFFSFLLDKVLNSVPMPMSSPVRIMSVGVVLLILTPYVRAILSVIYFLVEKNFKYFFITIFVLAVLTWSLAVH